MSINLNLVIAQKPVDNSLQIVLVRVQEIVDIDKVKMLVGFV